MIFVTVGTHVDPFDRLLAAAASLPSLDEKVVVQHGSGHAVSGTRSVAYMSYEEMVSHMRSADAVVCHAGVGSVLTAFRCGKRPIIMPRRGELGEHVDEHQSELAARLEEVDLVTVVHSESELHAALNAAGERPAPRLRRPSLELALGSYIRHHVGPQRPGLSSTARRAEPREASARRSPALPGLARLAAARDRFVGVAAWNW